MSSSSRHQRCVDRVRKARLAEKRRAKTSRTYSRNTSSSIRDCRFRVKDESDGELCTIKFDPNIFYDIMKGSFGNRADYEVEDLEWHKCLKAVASRQPTWTPENGHFGVKFKQAPRTNDTAAFKSCKIKRPRSLRRSDVTHARGHPIR